MFLIAAATAKSLQSCPTRCDPIDGSPPGSPVPGILQARTLEWVAISFSNAWKWKVKAKSLSRVWPSATPWTAAYQAPPSMGYSRQEYWSGLPLPSPHNAIQAYLLLLSPTPRTSAQDIVQGLLVCQEWAFKGLLTIGLSIVNISRKFSKWPQALSLDAAIYVLTSRQKKAKTKI